MDLPINREDLKNDEWIYNGRYIPIVYVLKCDKEKYYIGWTNNINSRLYLHLFGKGSYFCCKYEPYKLHHISFVPNDQSPQDYEREIYKWYKEKYPKNEVSMGYYDKEETDESIYSESSQSDSNYSLSQATTINDEYSQYSYY